MLGQAGFTARRFVISLQCSTKQASKPTGNWERCELIIYPQMVQWIYESMKDQKQIVKVMPEKIRLYSSPFSNGDLG